MRSSLGRRPVAMAVLAVAVVVLGGCGSSNSSPPKSSQGSASTVSSQNTATHTTSASSPATSSGATPSKAGSCLTVPASLFADIQVRGQVMRSAAIKSALKDFRGRHLYEVAARFDDGAIAVWSTAEAISGGGPTFPMNTAARQHSDQGVDVPSDAPALPVDPAGVRSAEACVS